MFEAFVNTRKFEDSDYDQENSFDSSNKTQDFKIKLKKIPIETNRTKFRSKVPTLGQIGAKNNTVR